jgi:hypothetical protein
VPCVGVCQLKHNANELGSNNCCCCSHGCTSGAYTVPSHSYCTAFNWSACTTLLQTYKPQHIILTHQFPAHQLDRVCRLARLQNITQTHIGLCTPRTSCPARLPVPVCRLVARPCWPRHAPAGRPASDPACPPPDLQHSSQISYLKNSKKTIKTWPRHAPAGRPDAGPACPPPGLRHNNRNKN